MNHPQLIRKSNTLCQLIEQLPSSEQQTAISMLAASVNQGIKSVEASSDELSKEIHQLVSECTCLTDKEMRATMGLSPLRRIYCRGYEARGAGGKLIVKFSNSQGLQPTSHVSLIFPCPGVGEEKIPWEIESIQGSGVIQHLHDPKAGIGQLYYMDVTSEEYDLMLKTAVGLIGAKYDWPGIKGFIFRSRRQDPNKWFCSELVTYVCKKGGRPITWKPGWKMSPYDVVTCRAWTPCVYPKAW